MTAPPASSGSSGSLRAALLPPLRAVLSLLLLGWVWWLVQPQWSASEQLAGGFSGPVPMPWVFHEVSRGDRLDLKLRLGWLTPRRWNIVPDDRLTTLRVNDQEVPLDRIPAAALSDYQHGFDIDLSQRLHRGDNRLQFLVDNTGGDGGITLRARLGWRWLLVGGALLLCLLQLARGFRLRPGQIMVLAAALVLPCAYLAATPWNLRAHDVGGDGGHYGYIAYVAGHLALPPPGAGWTFYHPPLYYIVAAAAWRWAQWLDLPVAETLQLLALLLWLVFLTASAGALRLALPRRPRGLLLATALLALWPGGFMHGLAIGNDAPLYAVAALATWWLLRWWRSRRRRHLLWAAVWIALGLLVKSNAVVLAAAAVMLLGLRLLRDRCWRRGLDAALAMGVIAAGAALNFGLRYYQYRHGEVGNWLIANVPGLPAQLRVPASLRAFLPLDVPVFLSTPWLDPYNDATGRANFWNYLLRSALSGEFRFDGALMQEVSLMWGMALLGLLWLLLVPDRWRGWSLPRLWRELPWLVLSLLWLASLVVLRIKMPYACSNDFRYILPLLVPFLVACTRAGPAARVLLAVIGLGTGLFLVAL